MIREVGEGGVLETAALRLDRALGQLEVRMRALIGEAAARTAGGLAAPRVSVCIAGMCCPVRPPHRRARVRPGSANVCAMSVVCMFRMECLSDCSNCRSRAPHESQESGRAR